MTNCIECSRSQSAGVREKAAMPTQYRRSKVGFPIRKSLDQSSFAAPQGLSQRTTSFIASQRQGIHRMLLRHLIALMIDVRRGRQPFHGWRPHKTTVTIKTSDQTASRPSNHMLAEHDLQRAPRFHETRGHIPSSQF